MKILNDKSDFNTALKSETEFVEQEQQEYTLLGTFTLKPGLRLFGFNYAKNEVFEVEINRSNLVRLKEIDGKLYYIEEHDKVTVDSKHTYFQALNHKSARKRVDRYLQGFIKELGNLQKPNPEGIKFY